MAAGMTLNRQYASDAIRHKMAVLTKKHTADHLADLGETSSKEIWKYGAPNGVQDMPSPVLVLLSRSLLELHNDQALLKILMPQDFVVTKQEIGKATGEVDSKILRFTKAFTGILQAQKTGNPEPLKESISKIESALADLYAELALIESRFKTVED